MIATIIILAVIILGGLYFWGQHRSAPAQTVPTTTATSDTSQTAAIENVSTADDTSSIEADLNTTNTSIDTGLQAS
jgi:cytoskeletal protein RodZ